MARTQTALVFAGLFLLSCSHGGAKQVKLQESGKPDISVREARDIPPFPPGHILVKSSKRGFVVKWSVNALDPTLTYKVYRTSHNSTVPIAQVKGGVFVDKNPPGGDVAYAVSTVNQYSVESVPSKPVAASK